MRLPSLEIVRLLKPRLGFGPAEAREEITRPDPVPSVQSAEQIENTKVSLVRLAEQLKMQLEPLSEPLPEEVTSDEPEDVPVDTVAEAFEERPSENSLASNTEALEAKTWPPSEAVSELRKIRSSLEGCKVGAIGFGRQDIAGLAATLLEQKARIEFLPRADFGKQGEFDLLLLNSASTETLKREMPGFRSALRSGIPSIVIGSRAALGLLRGMGDSRTWDFAAKPLHMEELVWRAINLLARCDEAQIPRQLPARVVVADHDAFTRTLIESALTRQGIQCELTEDGEAAWASIEKCEPGAVILDLTLPNRDGFQLLADIRRSSGRKPKVIVLSARQSEADILRAFALGADDYVTKPFSPLELSARLSRLLGGAPENA